MGDTAQGSRVGTQFGRYHLKRLLGRGGMGEVYEAEDTVKERVVALKLMSEAFSQDPVFRKRMQREARTAGRLQEPHVVPIHDYGEIDGQLYLEMRLIKGTNLDSLLKRFGPLDPPRAVAIIHQIASALDAAHAAGVMHRDIKPQNILVTRDDFAYLVDFGIASATTDEKLTQLGAMVGTQKYMAPERFTSAEVTYRADIYGLACVLYECLTGALPYRADSINMLITAHLRGPIPQPSAQRPGIPRAFDAVIARGMAKKADDRYASAGDLALAAHQALTTPDQDHAANIVRRSQESTLPGTVATAAGTSVPPAPTRHPDPAHSSPPPPSTPPPTRPWTPSRGPQPAITPQYFQPAGPPPQPRKRNPWPILAAASLVVITIVGGLGIYLVTRRPSNPQPSGTTTTTTTTTTTSPASGAQAQLLSRLPSGYPAGTCKPTTPDSNSIWANALAVVSCGQNTKPGGPSKARYGIFANADVLKKAFNDDINDVALANCPGGGPSPNGWHRTNTPNVTAGMIACGTYKNHPNVVWSNQDKLLLSDVFGDPATLGDLHTWWQKYG